MNRDPSLKQDSDREERGFLNKGTKKMVITDTHRLSYYYVKISGSL